jgi:hypothetical protein
MKYNTSLFESLKEALNKKSTSTNSAFKDVLKMEKGNTYIVRLLPNIEEPDKTFFHYFQHMWKSVVTTKIVSVLCPNTYGERCPIDEFRSKLYASKDTAQIEATKPLKRGENWMVNVYVIKDPTHPENNGTVKILRYGTQLHKVIDEALNDKEAAEEFGAKVFDLSKNGCNLRIKVEENEGGYAAYTASRFQSPSEIPGLDDPDSVYDSLIPMDTMFKQLSYDEIKAILDKDWFGKSDRVVLDKEEDDEDDVDDAPPFDTTTTSDLSADKKLDDIMKDL